MTPVELFYLLFGACVGLVAGAALLHVVRGPAARPEVRVTVTHNALPLRTVRPDTPGEPVTLRRTARGPGVPVPVPVMAPSRARVAVPVRDGIDPPLAQWREAAVVEPPLAVSRPAPADRPVALALAASARPPTAVAVLERPVAMAPANESARAAQAARAADEASAADVAGTEAPAGPCAGARQLAAERCQVAGEARDLAERAAHSARDARREYDGAVLEAETAARDADPRAIAARKEAARRAFHEATAAAHERRDLELAATVWLTEINRINQERRAALAAADAAGRRMEALLPVIERLTLAADAARITAETATAACNDARGALAACEEALIAGGATEAIAPPGDREPEPADDGADEGRELLRASGRQPAIYRLLHGDRDALTRIVDAAAATPEERRQLQLSLSGFVDAIVAGAIEQAFLDFPADHPFWGQLNRAESRQVAVGLAGLGYRFDGLGGFEGSRVPSGRDLSLAVGYAGLDPRRMRHWPSEADSHELYRGVSVAADEFLASAAPDMSLAELVAILGRRSESLADLWNQWGRVRPLLLATTG
ncbi:MAG: hypothetical protein ACHQZR_01840 [Candidatus Limnocylindrales bacterium]